MAHGNMDDQESPAKTKIAIFRDIFWWFRVTILCRGNVEGASFGFSVYRIYHWGFLPSKPTKGVIYESFWSLILMASRFVSLHCLTNPFSKISNFPFWTKRKSQVFCWFLPNVQSKKTKLQVVRSQKLAAGKMKRRMRTTRRLVECWLFTGKGEKKPHRIGVSVDSSTLKIAGSFWWHLMA